MGRWTRPGLSVAHVARKAAIRLGLGAAALVIGLGAGAERLAAEAAGSSEGREVVLRLKGGGFELAGTLKAFDGTRYVIDSRQHGRMTLNAARYECLGEACAAAPAAASLDYERLYPERAETVALGGPDALAAHLLPTLMRGLAEATGSEAQPVVGARDGRLEWRLASEKGQRLATIAVARGGSTAALAALRDGTATLALADRRAHDDEVRPAAAGRDRPGSARTEHFLGLDGLAVVVAPQNPLPAISLDLLARVLAGETADWYELGQPPGRINVHLRDGGSAQAARLAELLLAPRRLAIGASVTRHRTEAAVADAVARDHHSLGVVSLAAQRSARVVSLETSCGLRIGPSALSVKAGEYPLALPLYLYAATPPKEAAARNLLRFVTSPAAAEAIDGAGFMSLAPAMVGLDGQAERLAHATNAEREAFDLGHMRTMLADLKGWQRLSATIRLAGGAREADLRTKAEAERLAQLLQRSELKGRRVLLAGFTDVDGGKFQANLAHSAKRAAVVRSLVVAAGGAALDARRILAKGYGPLAPIACNDTAEGRALNRRVEVWVEGKGGKP